MEAGTGCKRKSATRRFRWAARRAAARRRRASRTGGLFSPAEVCFTSRPWSRVSDGALPRTSAEMLNSCVGLLVTTLVAGASCAERANACFTAHGKTSLECTKSLSTGPIDVFDDADKPQRKRTRYYSSAGKLCESKSCKKCATHIFARRANPAGAGGVRWRRKACCLR